MLVLHVILVMLHDQYVRACLVSNWIKTCYKYLRRTYICRKIHWSRTWVYYRILLRGQHSCLYIVRLSQKDSYAELDHLVSNRAIIKWARLKASQYTVTRWLYVCILSVLCILGPMAFKHMTKLLNCESIIRNVRF